MKNFIISSSIVIVACTCMFILIAVVIYPIHSYRCGVKGQGFDNAEFKFFAGCMVEHEGRWLPLENIRGFD